MCQQKNLVRVAKRLNYNTGVMHDVYDFVSCGKCEECISIHRSQWCFRAQEESKHAYNSCFLTLTYDNENLPENGVSVRHCQLFFKRVRRLIQLHYPQFDSKKFPLKYFLASEYGPKHGRPHYHLILWNCPLSVDELDLCWNNGYIKFGTTTPASIQYTLKYFIVKQDNVHGRNKNFVLMSKGIGKQWLSDNLYYDKSYIICCSVDKASKQVHYYKCPIPRYFRRKLKELGSYNIPEKSYDYDYRPDWYDGFSERFLASKGLKGKRNQVNDLIFRSVDKWNLLVMQSREYYETRDNIFRSKYQKINSKDSQ